MLDGDGVKTKTRNTVTLAIQPPSPSPSPPPAARATGLDTPTTADFLLVSNANNTSNTVRSRNMAPLSPRSSNYERLEGGMGPSRTGALKKRFGWKKFAIGATALIAVVYLFGPRETSSFSWKKETTGSAIEYPYDTQVETDPLPGPPEVTHKDQQRPGIPTSHTAVHPTSYETDPDPSKTTHCTTAHPSAARLVQYALMIDAGSTGSRIHVYKFNNCGASPTYEYEVFKMTQPGLSKFPGRPEEAAKSLDVLLDEAVRVIPKFLQACTPVAVKATAGLRLLPGSESADILKAVETRIHTAYPFQLQEKDGVVIMDGKDEGVYAWITANYLLDTIRADTPKDTPTYAVLDLGGASTQIVFEPVFASPDSRLEEGEHKYDLVFGGRTHVLYQHSYLGYGLMRARMHVHRLVDFMASMRGVTEKEKAAGIVGNPCLAKGTRRTVEIEDEATEVKKNVTMDGEAIGSFEACDRVVQLVMAKDAICELKPCSFNGVYQPSLLDSFPGGKVLLLSYFYDRVSPLLPSSTKLTVSTIAETARTVCEGHSSWVKTWGTQSAVMDELADRPEWCLDLTFMHALLRLGYEFEDKRDVTIGKQIEGTELGWCLGATIAMVGGELKCRI